MIAGPRCLYAGGGLHRPPCGLPFPSRRQITPPPRDQPVLARSFPTPLLRPAPGSIRRVRLRQRGGRVGRRALAPPAEPDGARGGVIGRELQRRGVGNRTEATMGGEYECM